MVGAVIFDMDGVLVDTEGIYLQWLREYLVGQGHYISNEKLCGIIGLSGKMSRNYLKKICGEDGEKLWNGYMKECDSYPFTYKKLVIPGVAELLRYLENERIPIALASSSNMEDIREMLNDTGFHKYFQVVTSGEMYRESKPNPEIYLHTAELLKQNPSDCIIIEDSYYGIRAGKDAGAYVIAKEDKRFGFSQIEADVIAKDLYHVKKIIEKKRRCEKENGVEKILHK